MVALTASLLGRLDPIRSLSRQRLGELATLCQTEHFPVGSDPLRMSQAGDQLIYLLAGELKVDFQDGGMRLLVGGYELANSPIGGKSDLPIAARAITEVDIARIDRDLLDIMMTWDQLSSVAETAPAETTLWSTMSGAFSVQALTNGCLASLPPAHIHELLRRFDRIKVKRGAVILREGEEGDYYYLLESGRCVVSRHVGGADMQVAELKSGDAFGEEALVSDAKRNATVTMKSDGVLLRLAKPDFVELLRAPLLRRLGRAEAQTQVDSGQAAWLDVRYAAEFSEDGLPGAINIPLNEIRGAFGVLDKKREYIVYCQSGRRSSAATFLLAQNGFKAYWLDGGLIGGESK